MKQQTLISEIEHYRHGIAYPYRFTILLGWFPFWGLHDDSDSLSVKQRMNTFMDMCISNLAVSINNEANHNCSFYTGILGILRILDMS